MEGRAGGGKPADGPAIRGHLLSGCSALPRPASERAAGRGGPGLRGARTRPRLRCRGGNPPGSLSPETRGPWDPLLPFGPMKGHRVGSVKSTGAGSQSHIGKDKSCPGLKGKQQRFYEGLGVSCLLQFDSIP